MADENNTGDEQFTPVESDGEQFDRRRITPATCGGGVDAVADGLQAGGEFVHAF